MIKTISLLLTLLVSLPLCAAAIVSDSGELVLSPVRFGPAAGGFRDNPDIAMGEGSFVVVWEERSVASLPYTGHIFARAFSPQGAPLQGGAIDLGEGVSPAIVWSGSDYFVVWSRAYPGASFEGPRPIVEGVRLDQNGRVIANSRVTIATGTAAETSGTDVGWSGSQYLIAWSGSGAVINRLGIPSATFATGLTNPAVAALGGQFVIIGTKNGKVEAVIVQASGEASSIGVLVDETGVSYALASRGGGEYVGVFASDRGVTALLLGPSGLATSFLTLTTDPAKDPTLTTTAEGFLTMWVSGATICYARFTTSNIIVSGCFNPDLDRRSPVVDAGIGSTAMAFIQRTAEDSDVIAYAVSVPPAPPDPRDAGVVSEYAQAQTAPTLLRDVTGTTVLWTEASSGRSQIWWGHVDDNGVRTADRLLIPASFAQTNARIAGGNGSALVVWEEQPAANRIMALRINAAGEGIGPPIFLGTGTGPDVAWNGRDWLVVWRSPLEAGTFRILASFVTEGGAAASIGALATQTGTILISLPRVVWNGREFLVVWGQNVGSNSQLVFGQRLSANGTPQGSAQVLINARGFATSPKVAWNGREYLVVTGSGLAVHVSQDLVPGTPFFLPPVAETTDIELRGRDDGLFAVVFASRTASQLVLVGAGNAAARIALPFAANSVDFLAEGNRLRLAYARDARPEENIGFTSRVFARIVGVEVGGVRRRAAR